MKPLTLTLGHKDPTVSATTISSIVNLFRMKTNNLPIPEHLHITVVCVCVLPPVGMSDEAIMELNLPTGIPILYELDKNLKPLKPMQFLGDEETVRKAMEAVAAQGKAKK